MNNIQLEKELKLILENKKNISSINKGEVSGNSIEIEYIEPQAYESYVYYDNAEHRDLDFDELTKQITEDKCN
jgi:hypothetical protein